MSDNKHNENWVDFYKAALLEEDPEKLLQRTDIAVDALRSRIWVLVGELHGEHNGHATDSGEWKALHDALRTLGACVITAQHLWRCRGKYHTSFVGLVKRESHPFWGGCANQKLCLRGSWSRNQTCL